MPLILLELISREVDLMGVEPVEVDLLGVDFMRVDLMGGH